MRKLFADEISIIGIRARIIRLGRYLKDVSFYFLNHLSNCSAFNVRMRPGVAAWSSAIRT
jgi:hypothetical protein